MTQWHAIVYKTGPQLGEVRSYGTEITDPLDTALYEDVLIDHQPGEGEEWDPTTKAVITSPIPSLTKREQLKAKPKATWTTEDIAEALQELL